VHRVPIPGHDVHREPTATRRARETQNVACSKPSRHTRTTSSSTPALPTPCKRKMRVERERETERETERERDRERERERAIYIYIERERERESARARARGRDIGCDRAISYVRARVYMFLCWVCAARQNVLVRVKVRVYVCVCVCVRSFILRVYLCLHTWYQSS